MKLHILHIVLGVLLAAHPACSGSDSIGGGVSSPETALGVLQFNVRHNLADDDCLADDSCFFLMEADDDPAAWLAEIGANASLAVLHWDRSIPWLAFSEDPPREADRVDFYDARLDEELLRWVDAAARYFSAKQEGFVAVSILSGERDRLERLRLGPGNDVVVTGACPEVAPGTVIEVEYEQAAVTVTDTFDLEMTYRNFVLYLHDKLRPDYLALMVEANLFKWFCPAQWPGFVDLYHALYEAVRSEVDPQTPLFATLVYPLLLDYDVDRCYGGLAFVPCSGGEVPPAYPDVDAETCYPLDLSAVTDLDHGDRLDVLALSFYPDALAMALPGVEDNTFYFYPEDWDGTGECLLRAEYPPFIDPLAQLDRFGWDKPIGLAEFGARSCRTLMWADLGEFALVGNPPGSPAGQAFWLDHLLSGAREREFAFTVYALMRDYQPIGLWTVDLGVLTPDEYNLLNNFACMGLYGEQGETKAGVTDLWTGVLR